MNEVELSGLPRRVVRECVRRAHWTLASRPELPSRLAIYMHALEREDWAPLGDAVRHLQETGYRFVDPSEVARGDGLVVSLSFDDNFRNWHDALPLFDELGICATFFTNTSVLRGETSAVELERYTRVSRYFPPSRYVPLSRGEIAELSGAGHLVQAHTHSHVALGRVSDSVAVDELLRNRAILEDITGVQVTMLAYPSGMPRDLSARARAVAVELDFTTICHATPGMLYAQGDPLAVHRTRWRCSEPLSSNLRDLRVDGRRFVSLTGRSPVG